MQAAARQAGLETVDYFRRPELAALNAVPTAEGCLCLLMQLRDRTLWQSPVLVLGYGRIGRALAERLSALGAWVTVAARSPEQRANARCAGCRAAPLEQLERLLPGFDAVVNTIPAPVLDRTRLACLPPGALVIDLASSPGGTDFAAAKDLGVRAEHALSLPARCAPQTAGELVADTVQTILQEREAPAMTQRIDLPRTVVFALCGSFCTFGAVLPQIQALVGRGLAGAAGAQLGRRRGRTPALARPKAGAGS